MNKILLKFQLFLFRHFQMIAVIALIGLISSCEAKIDWEIQNQELPTLVVEAILTNENKIQEVKLTRPVRSANEKYVGVSGASVAVSSGQFIYHFEESVEIAGLYQSIIPFAATVDRLYQLHIQDGEKHYTAQTYMIPVSVPNMPVFEFVSNQNKYSINWNNPQFHPLEQAMYEASISWGHLPGYENANIPARVRLTYFTLSTIDVNFNIAPQEAEQIFFPSGSIATLSKYSLTPGFASYLRALLAETQWQGSIFESARGNLRGNISNGALGYFGACSVIRVTLIVD